MANETATSINTKNESMLSITEKPSLCATDDHSPAQQETVQNEPTKNRRCHQLYILPNTLSPEKQGELAAYKSSLVTEDLRHCLEELDGILCESARGARRLLQLFSIDKPLYILPLDLKKIASTPSGALSASARTSGFMERVQLAKKVLKELFGDSNTSDAIYKKWGLISDAGLISVADPGAAVIYAARSKKLNIQVNSFYGMSSITLALSLSGLEGKRFGFEGYLPYKKLAGRASTFEAKGKAQLSPRTLYSQLECSSAQQERIICWMETPYRHKEAVLSAIDSLQDDTFFSVVQNIATAQERVITLPVSRWKGLKNRQDFVLEEGPAIYLIRSY